MQNLVLTKRYATAFFRALVKEEALLAGYTDVKQFQDWCVKYPALPHFLASPRHSREEKSAFLGRTLQGVVQATFLRFLQLMARKGRADVIVPTLAAFLVQYREYQQMGIAHVIVAHPIAPPMEKAFHAVVKKITGWQDVELQIVIKPAIIGGCLLRVGDKQLDASLAARLKQLKQLWSRGGIDGIQQS